MDTSFDIRFARAAIDDLGRLSAYHRARIVHAIEVQLRNEPARQTRNRKILAPGSRLAGEEPPVWELRVGAHRVFYDVHPVARRVVIRFVRFKGTGTTGGIL